MLEPKETYYNGTAFRSRIEARWAVFFDALGVEWEYEPEHHELGLKHQWDWEDEEELQEALSEAWDEDERDEIRRQAWWKKHEKRLYLPDFWLPEYECWVEIKGKAPTPEERIKARKLSSYEAKDVHILWGSIPDPEAKVWGECSDVYGSEISILALLTVEYGIDAMKRAFTAARQARF